MNTDSIQKNRKVLIYMTFKKFISKVGEKTFIIEEDLPEIGAYLYIYQGEKCIKDILQDYIDICKQVAFEDFNVPLDSWKCVE